MLNPEAARDQQTTPRGPQHRDKTDAANRPPCLAYSRLLLSFSSAASVRRCDSGSAGCGGDRREIDQRETDKGDRITQDDRSAHAHKKNGQNHVAAVRSYALPKNVRI